MSELPAPTTLSPGKLKLIYTSGSLVHEVGSNFGATVDITNVTSIRTEAGTLADHVKAVVPNTVFITGWKITDPAGVTLYEEVFSPVKTGTLTPPSDAQGSESASVALTGKGAPSVGLKQGQTKFTVFPNFYSVAEYALPKANTPGTAWEAIRTQLNTSTLIGCDFYGSPGVWRDYLSLQINAHFQKKYGI